MKEKTEDDEKIEGVRESCSGSEPQIIPQSPRIFSSTKDYDDWGKGYNEWHRMASQFMAKGLEDALENSNKENEELRQLLEESIKKIQSMNWAYCMMNPEINEDEIKPLVERAKKYIP